MVLLAGCEVGVDQSKLVKANFDLLCKCERPEFPRITAIVDDALCGFISVFEDRESKSGRKIDLNVMLLPATTSVVKPDPIFFLAGGPGQSAVDVGPYLFAVLRDLRKKRDIVLIDQRGTGDSNSLSCVEESLYLENFDLTVAEVMAKQVDEQRICLQRLDADPALYTTPIAMDDLNEVREILGYQKINLLGGSYGTRAALVYMRRHPYAVRSAILDGVVPLTMAVPANIAVDAQSSFELLLVDCQAQPACAAAFPSLELHFRELVQRHRDEVIEVSVAHPRTGERVKGKIDPLIFSRLVHAIMYERTMTSLLPLAIEEAYNGNLEPLGTLGYALGGEGPLVSLGMMASVLCAEDMTLVNEPHNSKDFDNQLYRLLKPICEFWPKGSIPERYFEAVSSDIPTLLLSGKLDPVTPPKYGWEAAATLSNSKHIVVAGVGHGVMIQGCVPGILSDFFDKPNPKEVKAACTTNLVRPDFFTSLAGPTTLQVIKEGPQ